MSQIAEDLRIPGEFSQDAPSPKHTIGSPNIPRRKILIIEDEPSISNILFVLVNDLNYDGEVAMTGRQALAMVARQSFDAVLLDLRYSQSSTERMLSLITEIQPSLVDRILVITSEVGNPEVMDVIGHQYESHVSQNRLIESVHRMLRSLWDPSPLA